MTSIFPLSEGVFTIGHDKIFRPFDPQKDNLNDRPIGSLLVEVQPFLIVTKSDVMLFDTGLGFEINGELQIHQNIRNHGYQPEDVTKVFMSHLHKDHAGGVSYKNHIGQVKLSFPEAIYYVFKSEADIAMQDHSLSYIKEEISPLLNSEQVVWLSGDSGKIDASVQFFHSGGHCKHHIVYLLDDGTDKIFFGGDEAPQLKQMKIKYVAKYDYDGKKAMELREHYAQKGKEEGWKFLFYHDVKMPVASL